MENHSQRISEIKDSQRAESERRHKEAQQEKLMREHRRIEIEKERERSLRRRLNYSLLDDRESKGDISLLDNSLMINSARGHHTNESSKLRIFATTDSLKKRSASIQGPEEIRRNIGEKVNNICKFKRS